jgi:hypothetical protein
MKVVSEGCCAHVAAAQGERLAGVKSGRATGGADAKTSAQQHRDSDSDSDSNSTSRASLKDTERRTYLGTMHSRVVARLGRCMAEQVVPIGTVTG